MGESNRNAEIATTFKFIASRVLQIKSLAEETETTTADMAKAEKALDKFNITIRAGNGDLKNLDDILLEVSEKWRTLSDSEKQYLSETLAGNRQRSGFVSIMESMTKQQELYNIALGSSGTMMEAQEKHIDSFEGKLGRLKATSQAFWSNFLDSNGLKGFLDGLTGAIDLLDKFTQKFGGLTTGTTLLTGFLSLSSKGFRDFSKNLTSCIPGIRNLHNGLSNLEAGYRTQISNLTENIAVQRESIAVLKANGDSTVDATAKLKGYQNQLSMAKVGMLGVQAVSVALNTALSMLASFAISALVSWLAKGIDYIVNFKKHLQEFNEETIQSINDSGKTITQLDSLLQKKKELDTQIAKTQGVEERKVLEEELLNIQKEIASVAPQVASGITSEGDAYAESNSEIQEHIDLLKKKQEQEALELLDKNKNQEQTFLDIKNLEKYKEAYDEMLLAYKRGESYTSKESFINGFGELDEATTTITKVTEETLEQQLARIEEAQNAQQVLYQAVKTLTDSGNWTLPQLEDQFGIDLGWIQDYENSLNGLGDTASETGGELNGLTVTPFTSEIENAEEKAQELAETLDKISTPMNNFESSTSGFDLSRVSDEFKSIAESAEEAQTAIEKLTGVFDEINAGKTLLEQMKKDLEENGTLSSNTKKSVIDSGNVDLISLLNNPDLYGDVIRTLEEYGVIEQQTADQIIANADKEIESRQRVAEQWEIEKANIQDYEAKWSQIADSTIDNNGKITNANGEVIKSLSAIGENVDGTKQAIIDLNGEPVLISFDEKGNIIEGFQEVTEGVEGAYYAIEKLEENPVLVTFNGKEQIVSDFSQVTQYAEDTFVALTELDGKQVLVKFDSSGQIVGDFKEVKVEADGAYSAIDELNGQKVLITSDGTEQTITDLQNIQENTDGTISAIADLNGQKISVRFDENGNIIGDLTELTEIADNTYMAIKNINGQRFVITFDGQQQTMSQISNVKNCAGDLKQAIIDVNGQHFVVTFDNKGQIVSDLESVTRTADGTYEKIDQVNGRPVTVKLNGKSNVINGLASINGSIDNTRRKASKSIVITTIHRNVTQNVTTGGRTGATSSSNSPQAYVGGENDLSTPSINVLTPSEASIDAPGDLLSESPTIIGSSDYDGTFDSVSEPSIMQPSIPAPASIASISKQQGSKTYDEDDVVENINILIDRYYKLNDVLEDFNNLLDINSKKQENAYGKKKIDLIREEVALLEKKRIALQNIQNAQNSEIEELKKQLSSNGFVLDSYGNIINAEQELMNKRNNANGISDKASKENYINYVEDMVDLVDRYTELCNSELPETIKNLQDLNNTIEDIALNQVTELREQLVDALKSQIEFDKETEISALDSRIEELKQQIEDLDTDAEDRLKKKAKLEKELAKWQMDDSVNDTPYVQKCA